MDSLADRLKWAREQHGKFVGRGGPTEAANAFGWPVSTYLGHENGDRPGARLSTIKRYAKAYGVRWEWLLEGSGQPLARPRGTMPVRGYVGAGAEFIPASNDDPGLGDAPLAVEPNSEAVIVRGDSMYPRYFDGEYIYYVKELRDPRELVGRECVVKLVGGGMYIKVLRRGSTSKLFNLESWNAHTIEDQKVEWAAPVTWRRG